MVQPPKPDLDEQEPLTPEPEGPGGVEQEARWLREQLGLTSSTEAPKAPRGRTPSEEAVLAEVLASLGIILPPALFTGFLKALRQSYNRALYRKAVEGNWAEYIELLAVRRIVAPLTEGRPEPEQELDSPMEEVLADWLLEQERAQAAKGAEKEQTRQAALAEKADKLGEAQFKDAYADLSKRYPGNKHLLNAMAAEAMDAWKQERDKARARFTGLPPEMRAEFGIGAAGVPGLPGFMPQFPDFPPAAFIQGQDWGAFAKEQGFGSQWEQGQFREAFEVNIAEPMRKAATTPGQKLAVERQIAQLESVAGPALQAQFKEAQIDAPDLNFDTFFQSDIARGIVGEAQRASQNRVQAGDQAKARTGYQKDILEASELASRGFGVEEGAAMMGITEAEYAKYAQGALQLRQYAVGQATRPLGPAPGAPAGEIRGGEFGEIVMPQRESVLTQYRAIQDAAPGTLSNRQLIQTLQSGGLTSKGAAEQLAAMTPEERQKLVQQASSELGQQQAWLNQVTSGEWGQKTEQQMVAASQQANTRAAAEARESIRGGWNYFYKDIIGRQGKLPAAEQKRVQEILADKQFQPYLKEIIGNIGGAIEEKRAATVKAYGGQLSGGVPTRNLEFMLGAFINEISPAFDQFKGQQKEYQDTLQQNVQKATTPQGQAQALAALTAYKQKIAPPPLKNPFAGTDFIDGEVRWAAEHDQPNPYPNAPGLKEIYAGAFKGPTTSANYPAVQEVVTRQQEAQKAQNAAQAQANALRLADMQRRAGVIQQPPPGARQPGGGPVPTAGPGPAQAPAAAAPGGKPPFEQWLRAALGATPETPDLRARLQAQYNTLSEADVRRHLGLPAAAPAPVGRAFGGGPAGAGPVRVDEQGNVVEDLGTPGRVGGRQFMGPPVSDVVGRAMKDTAFTPELSQFIAQNRQNVGGAFETADQVASRLGPQISDLYSAYQAKKTKPPVSTFEPDVSIQPVLEKGAGREFKGGPAGGGQESIQPASGRKGGREFKGPPVEVFDYQGP